MNRLITIVIAYIACQSIVLAASVVDIAVAPQTDSRSYVDVVITFQGAFEDVANCRCEFVATNGVTHTEIPVSHINQIGPDEGSDLSWTRRFVWEAEKDIGPVRIDELEFTIAVQEKTIGVQLWKDGPYWAECNVGANSSSSLGYYFAWGDTNGCTNVPYRAVQDTVLDHSFSIDDCPMGYKSPSQLLAEGFVDEKGNLVSKYDAAAKYVGRMWRMPTASEFTALMENCTGSWLGTSVMRFTGKKQYADKHISLPITGHAFWNRTYGDDGVYWTSTPSSKDPAKAMIFTFDGEAGYTGNNYTTRLEISHFSRSYGCTIRPVRDAASFANFNSQVRLSIDCREIENPVITPESGTTFDSSLSVSMTCASEGATIHYTTDGSEPTMESPVYKRFRIYGKTTVKARAFYENGEGSEIVTAEYALGCCPEPVVVSAGGETFYHSGNVVTIEAARESASSTVAPDQVVRYTVDGSEPTAESPIYTEPFTIDASTIVKAKAFSDSFFDSAVVTANLTREWEVVATPVITAADSFSGSKTTASIACATDGALVRYTTDGSEPNSHSKRYTGPFEVTASTVVKAYAVLSDYTDSAVAVKTITKVWCIGDSLGLPDHSFATDGDANWTDDGGAAMKSGAIQCEQTSSLKSTFVGKGRLAFELKLACEEDDPDFMEYDHYELWIDSMRVVKLDGEHDWTSFGYDLGAGTHVVEWRYVKDELDDQGTPKPDGIWVRNVVWMPEMTQTTEVPVPTAWLKAKYPSLGDYYFDYEEQAKAVAANGVNTVWECYVIGLEPTAVDARFVAAIEMLDGVPKVTWSPDFGAERVYKVLGSTDLKTWTEVTEATKGAYNFFKVAVEMP